MKNAIGYRKIIYILLTALVLALSLTACGEDSSDDDKKDKGKKKQTIAESKEEDNKEADEETEPVLGWIPKETTESVWDSIEEPAPKPTASPVVKVDKYQDYFKKYGSIIKENVEIKVAGEYKGIGFTMKYAYNDNYLFMEIESEAGDYSLQMIGTIDKLCVGLEMDELDRKYANIDIDSIEELDGIFLVEEFLALAEGITNEHYKESKISNDEVCYDIISASVKDYRTGSWHDVKSYIYSDTQKPSKIIIYFENDEKISVSFNYMSEEALNGEIEEKIARYTNSDKKLVSLDKIQEMYDTYFELKPIKVLFENIVK